MKLFTKILFCTTTVITVALCVMGYLMISDNFENALSRETQRGLEEYQLLKFTFQSGILSAYESGGLDSDMLKAVAGQTAQLAPSGGQIAVLDEAGDIILSTFPAGYQFAELGDVNEQGISYATENLSGQYRQVFIGKLTQSNRTVYLLTSRNITAVIQEKQAQQHRFIISLIIVMGASIIVMLALSMVLTTPIKKLIYSTRLFARGKYGERAQVRTGDEIGELADNFNQMAGTIQDTIAKLKLNAQQKEDFVANFAHELKTPLTSVIGYADMIYQRKDMGVEDMREAAGYIVNEGMRLEALSIKLMELIVLGKQDFTFLDMLTGDVFRDVSDTLYPVMERRGVQFTVNAQPAYISIEYDLFKTLLLNLIDNGVKAGGKHISLSGKLQGRRYAIEITDDGCGIPQDKLSRITEAFYMVNKSRSRSQHGAGLGLAIASRIAELHNTELEFMSQVGVGTVVRILLIVRED